jgi:glyoxylase-like metal-dependent hydrolase (beta-lactamase superfamily II)
MLDRRQLLVGVIGGLLGSLVLPRRSAARQAGIVRLNDRLSLVTSGRTNVLALSTAGGLVLVDSGAPELSVPLMASLRQISPAGRVGTVFNTHWHPENTGANDVLRQGGAGIVAHENTRIWMATPTWIPAEDRYRPARPRPAHPDETFHADGTRSAGRERIDYGYLIEAHTSGDIYVFFRDSNVLAVGDVASPARDPELDWFTGAWLGGRVDAIDRLLALSDDGTRIVPGYGPVMRREDLQAERDMMATIYERAVDRVRQADSVDDMLAGGLIDGLPRRWNDPRTFVHAVHKGLWAHHDKLAPDVV